VLAKSITPNRIAENKNLVALNATDQDEIGLFLEPIKAKKAFTRYVYPAFGVDFGFPDKTS
jgi:glycerol 2-dehydrogenase (NADP+)